MIIRIPTKVKYLEWKDGNTYPPHPAGWYVLFEGSWESLLISTENEKPKDLIPGTEVEILIIAPRRRKID